jgi:transcriptional regulator with XRE-family HTH domain
MKGNIDPNTLYAMRVQIGEWLREKRKEKGLSQQELADKMWVGQDTVSKVEAGKWALSVDMLTLFCHHLDIPIKKIFANA